MAATQELVRGLATEPLEPSDSAQPSWLTVSTSVYTDANGVATTATAVLYLPLTYYGPSVRGCPARYFLTLTVLPRYH